MTARHVPPGTWVGTAETSDRERRRSSESIQLVHLLVDEIERSIGVTLTQQQRSVTTGALGRSLDYGRELEREETIVQRKRAELAEARVERLRSMLRRKDPRRE